MPETPEQLYARVANALRVPPVETWDTYPFEGPASVRALRPPSDTDPARHGAQGIDCRSCTAPDDDYVWTNERWRLSASRKPAGLPVVVLLHPREHFAEPGDLPDELAADLGIMIAKVERAIRSIGDIGRVHVCRWGDGGEHLHWWFMARPARIPQLLGSFAAVWDEILPPTPDEIWKDNLERVVQSLSTS